MDISQISVRYAKALLAFARLQGEEEAVYGEMCRLADAFVALPALQQTLQNPVVSDADKEKLLLLAGTDDKSDASASLKRFVALLLRNRRADLMLFVAHSFLALYRKEKGIVKGRLVVARPVSEALQRKFSDIVSSLTKSTVDFEVKLDESIKGGFVLEYGTYRLDASVKTRLERMRRELAR